MYGSFERNKLFLNEGESMQFIYYLLLNRALRHVVRVSSKQWRSDAFTVQVFHSFKRLVTIPVEISLQFFKSFSIALVAPHVSYRKLGENIAVHSYEFPQKIIISPTEAFICHNHSKHFYFSFVTCSQQHLFTRLCQKTS